MSLELEVPSMKSQMKSLKTYYIGIDISKDKLDVFTRHNNEVKTTANLPKDIGKLIAKLAKEHENIHLVCEATGGYEKPLLKAAFKACCLLSHQFNERSLRAFLCRCHEPTRQDRPDRRANNHPFRRGQVSRGTRETERDSRSVTSIRTTARQPCDEDNAREKRITENG
jgi:transposase